jgi:surface carbohydrate biosynthesis protein
MKTKILITVGYKKRELAYISLLVFFLQKAGFEVKVKYANFEVYALIAQWRPDILILGQVTQTENIQVGEYGRKTGAWVVVLNCEGTYNPQKQVRRFGKKVNHFVDYMLAWGKQHYHDAQKFSDLPKEKVVITGTPKIDLYLPALQPFYAAMTGYEKQLQPRRKTICLCTSFASADQTWEHVKKNNVYADMGEEENKRIVAGQKKLRDEFIALAKDIVKLNKYNLIFRIHPLEDKEYYQQHLASIKSEIIFDNTLVPQKLLTQVDLLIHRTSTLATEAWMKGVATLSFDPIFNDDSEILDFTQLNPLFHNRHKVVEFIKQELTHSSSKKYLTTAKKKYLKHWYSWDSKDPILASNKITDLLLRLKKRTKKTTFSKYVLIHLGLWVLKVILRKKYVYEVIGMIKGQEYVTTMRHNYILDNEVAKQVEVYRHILT